jgi:hypothetical protein
LREFNHVTRIARRAAAELGREIFPDYRVLRGKLVAALK